MNDRKPAAKKAILVTVLICVAASAVAFLGFYLGKVTERNRRTTEVSAVARHIMREFSMRDILKAQTDEQKVFSILDFYNIKDGDDPKEMDRLSRILLSPPSRPAPFVGHMARPFRNESTQINVVGFRDKDRNYAIKGAGVVRIFLTGGSTAWGAGAELQEDTIAAQLESRLNAEVTPVTGFAYEVVNTAYPAWSTTQERILVSNRLLDMCPDVILMFSGNNDVHWAWHKQNILWFDSYQDKNYLELIRQSLAEAGDATGQMVATGGSRRPSFTVLAERTWRNVKGVADVCAPHDVRVVFALQPNMYNTSKPLTPGEAACELPSDRIAFYREGYKAIRSRLQAPEAGNFSFVDLSDAFGALSGEERVFLDPYHFGAKANRIVVDQLLEAVNWAAFKPNLRGCASAGDGIKVTGYGPKQAGLGEKFLPQPDGSSAFWFKVEAAGSGLLVTLDGKSLATATGADAITATVPPTMHIDAGVHILRIVDSMTGEASPDLEFVVQ